MKTSRLFYGHTCSVQIRRRLEEGRCTGTLRHADPFTFSAHQTGRARFEHPAFGQTSPKAHRRRLRWTSRSRNTKHLSMFLFRTYLTKKCGNVLSAPQCLQWALQMTSVFDRSIIVLSTIPHGDGPNHIAAFVAKDIGLAFAQPDHQTVAALNLSDVLVRDNRQVVEV